MKNKDKIIVATIQTLIVMSVTGASLTTTTASAASANEKCYGIAKAHMNDCGTATSTCAASATKNAQPDAFLLVPTGLCKKIMGGTIKVNDNEIKKH